MNQNKLSRQYLQVVLFIMIAGLALMVGACTNRDDVSSDEESGIELALDETYDQVRSGARLVLSLNQDNNTFNGFVENTTAETLKHVRVEVHLSTGISLGPTTPVDLAPGERKDIKLFAKNYEFDSWTVNPEVEESGSE